MKAAGPLSLALVLTGTLAGAESLPGNPAEHGVSGTNAGPAVAGNGAPSLSARISTEIRTGLPAYAPPPARPKDTPGEAASSDSDVFELPKLTVREKVQPRMIPHDLMTPRALNRKFAADYKKSLKGLDSVLNGFSIPLFGPSLAARGRAQYRAQEYRQMFNIIDAIATADPAQAAELRREMVNALSGRPPGSK